MNRSNFHPASPHRAYRHDLAIFAAALLVWLAFVQSFAWSTADRAPHAIVAACIAYSLAMCKFLFVAPLARPVVTVMPMLVALFASWAATRTTESFWLDRAMLIAQSVAFVALGYFFLAVYRVQKGYVFRTPDGGTDGIDTDKLFLDLEKLRSRLIARRKLKILFPGTEWEEWLRLSFRLTRDELSFAELSAENIRASDLVVPLRVGEIVELDRFRPLLAGNPIPVPSRECVALCDDKYSLNKALIANGFGAYVPSMDGDLPYPYILKKRSDEWAVNSHVIANAQQEQAYAGLLEDPDYFRQRFILGKTEYTTHILMRNRRIVCALSIKFVFDKELQTKGRECVASYSKLCRSAHLDVFAAMLRSINFEGLCCMNYKIVDGRPAIFEINPRFGASLVPWFFTFVRRAV